MRARTLDPASGVRSFWALPLLLAALVMPGLIWLPPIDRDEARFMQATKQMVERGDYGRIVFQDQPRDKKPIGAHWAQAAAVKVVAAGATATPWPYRLPSLAGAMVAALATAWAARGVHPAAGLGAGVVLATMPLVLAEAHLAKADALLLGLSAIVFAGLLAAYARPPERALGWSLIAAAWLALGAGVLVKGPILPAVVGLAVVTLGVADRSLAWLARLKPLIGVPLMLAVLAAWPLVAGPTEVLRFAAAAVSQDFWPKLAGGMEGHGAPPGAHALAAALTLWPWSLAVPAAAAFAWRRRREAAVRLALAWIVPFWLALELVPTKLPHYPLPVLPALAVVMALALATRAANAWTARRFVLAGVGGLAVLVAAAAVLAAALADRLPRLADLDLSRRLAAAATRHAGSDAPTVLVGYHEPSAVFLLGTDTVLTNAEDAAARLAAAPDALAAVTAAEVPALEAALTPLGLKIVRLEEIPGYNYSRGAPVTLIVLRVLPPTPP